MIKERTRMAVMGDCFSLAVSFEDGVFSFEPLQSINEPPRGSLLQLDVDECIPGASLEYATNCISYADNSCLTDYEEQGIEHTLDFFLFVIEECMREGLPF